MIDSPKTTTEVGCLQRATTPTAGRSFLPFLAVTGFAAHGQEDNCFFTRSSSLLAPALPSLISPRHQNQLCWDPWRSLIWDVAHYIYQYYGKETSWEKIKTDVKLKQATNCSGLIILLMSCFHYWLLKARLSSPVPLLHLLSNTWLCLLRGKHTNKRRVKIIWHLLHSSLFWMMVQHCWRSNLQNPNPSCGTDSTIPQLSCQQERGFSTWRFCSVQAQAGQDSEQPDQVEDVPAYCREVGLGDL